MSRLMFVINSITSALFSFTKVCSGCRGGGLERNLILWHHKQLCHIYIVGQDWEQVIFILRWSQLKGLRTHRTVFSWICRPLGTHAIIYIQVPPFKSRGSHITGFVTNFISHTAVRISQRLVWWQFITRWLFCVTPDKSSGPT